MHALGLYCVHNKLESLDNFYSADWVNCSYNNIKELNGIIGCLQYLKCDHNQLTNLNIDKLCYELEEVYCDNNNITSIDFTNAKIIKKVVCDKKVELIGLPKKVKVKRK